jgi:hypothetical protein
VSSHATVLPPTHHDFQTHYPLDSLPPPKAPSPIFHPHLKQEKKSVAEEKELDEK